MGLKGTFNPAPAASVVAAVKMPQQAAVIVFLRLPVAGKVSGHTQSHVVCQREQEKPLDFVCDCGRLA